MAKMVYEEGDEVKLLKIDTVGMQNLLKDARTEEGRGNNTEAAMLRKDAEIVKNMKAGGTYVVAGDQTDPDELIALVVGSTDEIFVRPALVKLIK